MANRDAASERAWATGGDVGKALDDNQPSIPNRSAPMDADTEAWMAARRNPQPNTPAQAVNTPVAPPAPQKGLGAIPGQVASVVGRGLGVMATGAANMGKNIMQNSGMSVKAPKPPKIG